ncbi:AI-2E family transporter [Collinsella tanakaei]|uniref:AI-2E family transporter n=1 Tax=Collinsella tanakaei TaxID=626935 RepID=UPI0026EA9BDD|nr:AI-2E family transporter [Collinsella tanakaei]
MVRTPSRDDRDRSLKSAFLNVWTVIGCVIIFLIVLNLLGLLSGTLLFLAVGCISAFIASPLVNWLERHRVPRGAGALLGILVVIVAVLLLFVIAIPLMARQLLELLSHSPSWLSALGRWFVDLEQQYAVFEHFFDTVKLDSLMSSLGDLFNQLASGLLASIKDGIVPIVNNIASTTFTVFLGLVLAYWLALDYPKINDEICGLLGEDRALDYRLMVAVVSSSVGGYLRSTLINSLIQGFLAFLGFALVGHPYAAAMGVLSGVLNIIPVVGPSISAIIASLIALFYSPMMAVWTMVMAMLSQNVTDNVIAPKINQSTMQVHPVLSLTALVIGSTLGGTVGMIIALPIAAVLKSLFIFYYESRTNRQLVSYAGALFRGTPFLDEKGDPVPAFDALGNDTFVADSQIIDDESVPKAEAVPKPHLDNPWSNLNMFENMGATGVFKNPFASMDENSKKHGDSAADEDDGK